VAVSREARAQNRTRGHLFFPRRFAGLSTLCSSAASTLPRTVLTLNAGVDDDLHPPSPSPVICRGSTRPSSPVKDLISISATWRRSPSRGSCDRAKDELFGKEKGFPLYAQVSVGEDQAESGTEGQQRV
jgi:hypothetical protein